MAEIYGFFNGLEYDEKFPMILVASLIPTGVYNDSLHVSAGTGLNVSVAAGKAWVNGYFYFSDASQQIATNIADAENPRKDVIVLRLDKVTPWMGVSYKAGTPSINPVPPALQRDSDVYELQLAEILFPAGSSSISAATITDTRSDADLCGITAGFQGLDVEGLTEQAQAQFNEWFDSMKNQLSTDAAGNLQIQVDAINNSKGAAGGIASLDTDGIVPLDQQGIANDSNSNGNYIKLPDGTMVCYKTVSWAGDVTTAYGSLFTTGSVIDLGNFAVPFLNIPNVTLSLVNESINGTSGILDTLKGLTKTYAGKAGIIRPTSITGGTFSIHVKAIGYWK